MIKNITKNITLATKVVLANTSLTRMRGLLGKASLEEDSALVILPCQSVHMFFMKFSIDVVFVNKDNVVVGLCSNIPPFAFSPIFWKSACAIELPTGTIERTKTEIGDLMSNLRNFR